MFYNCHHANSRKYIYLATWCKIGISSWWNGIGFPIMFMTLSSFNEEAITYRLQSPPLALLNGPILIPIKAPFSILLALVQWTRDLRMNVLENKIFVNIVYFHLHFHYIPIEVTISKFMGVTVRKFGNNHFGLTRTSSETTPPPPPPPSAAASCIMCHIHSYMMHNRFMHIIDSSNLIWYRVVLCAIQVS